jgi:hypothetical protein
MQYFNEPPRENIKPLIAHLDESLEPGDKIYASIGSIPAFEYYYQGNNEQQITVDYYDKENCKKILLKELRKAGDESERIWLVFTHYGNEEIKQAEEVLKAKSNFVNVLGGHNKARLYLAY